MESPQPLAARLDALLEGVHPGWPAFFEKHGLTPKIRRALEAIEPDADKLSPQPGRIFEAFRYFAPEGAKVLLLGQDPYPTGAQGLSFSIPAGWPLKASLLPVVKCLESHGLARVHYNVQDDPCSGRVYSGDLTPWAVQGVLLLNAALTTRTQGRNTHPSAWKAFTQGFVRALSEEAANAGRLLICMLWGGSARSFAQCVLGGHPVYQWTHPSPLINNRLSGAARFENMPHFGDANQALRTAGVRPIEWDPLGFTYAFTDGSCPRNGQPDAVASFAAYVMTGPLKGVRVRGRVEPRAYALVDPADPAKGFAPAPEAATPTNNRGEYLAWCWLLLLMLRGGVRGRAEIISDCNLFIQTMEDWLPRRRQKGTAAQLANFDLVAIAEALLGAFRAQSAGVRLTHIRSHQKKPPATDPRALALWHGNDSVDKEAGALTANDGAEGPTFELSGADASMRWRLAGPA